MVWSRLKWLYDFIFDHRRDHSVDEESELENKFREHMKECANKQLSDDEISQGPFHIGCNQCGCPISDSSIACKYFVGRHGSAILVKSATNIYSLKPEYRNLSSGAHVVADICCRDCNEVLGWMYIDAANRSQKYKLWKYILECEKVAKFSHWNRWIATDAEMVKKSLDVNLDVEMKPDEEFLSLMKDPSMFHCIRI